MSGFGNDGSNDAGQPPSPGPTPPFPGTPGWSPTPPAPGTPGWSPTPPAPGTPGWSATPPAPTPTLAPGRAPVQRSRSNLPVLLAVLVAVIVAGGIVFVVKSKSSTDSTEAAAGLAETTTRPSIGSTPSTSTPSNNAPTPTFKVPSDPTGPLDDATTEARLKAMIPGTDALGLLSAADPSKPGTWTAVESGYTPAGQSTSACGAGLPADHGLYTAHWGLLDANGGIHGQAILQATQFDSSASARAAVTGRRTPEFSRCHLKHVQSDLVTQTQGSGSVQPAVTGNGGTIDTPTQASTTVSTSEDYTTAAGDCTYFTTAIWQQLGPVLLTTYVETCGTAFPSEAVAALDKLFEATAAS